MTKKTVKESLKEKVYSILKEKIVHFELKPGEKIQERNISETLGISRTPIREALNRLEQEKLVVSSPFRGCFVSNITYQDVEDLYEIREILEVHAIKIASKKGEPKDWDHIEQILLNGKKGGNPREDRNLRLDIGRKFHEEIIRISGNKILQEMFGEIADRINRVRWMDIFFIDRAQESFDDHFKILEGIRKGRVEEAVTITREHIQKAKASILHLLEMKRNLFYITDTQ